MTIYNISEQCVSIIGGEKAPYQSIVAAVKNAYASVVLKMWYATKLEGFSELPGSSIYTFSGLTPELDVTVNQYAIILPSSYVEIPNEMGVPFVGFALSQDKPFVRLAPGMQGLLAGLKSSVLGGYKTFEITGNKIYFPNMKKIEVADIMLKLSVGFSDDVDEELNIPPNIADEIVAMVVQRFSPVPASHPDTLIK